MKRIKHIALAGTLLGAAVLVVQNGTPVTLSSQLIDKTTAEQADIKADAISKLDLVGTYTDMTYGITVEIHSITKIANGGVEIFARAWKGAQQLGFGADGTVEIERFQILNPPIMVADPTGNFVSSWVNPEGIAKEARYREAPLERTKQELADIIHLVGKTDGKIIKGKIGNTTTTVYSVAGANSPVDGRTTRSAAVSWADTRTGAGTSAADSSTVMYLQSENNPPGGTSFRIDRLATLFDITSIPDTDTINSATYSVYAVNDTDNTEATNPADPTLVGVTLASDAAVGTGDFALANWGTTLYATTLDLTAFSVTGYVDFTVNAAGITFISTAQTGGNIVRFAIRGLNDINNAAPTARSYGGLNQADNGAGFEPRLVVVHSAATTGVNSFILIE